ncbi:MAG TPA: hypothetical protein VGO47_08780 [Chlamydiales bacterium]|nr:hypothetical protein [Chlamydiales bacterium]
MSTLLAQQYLDLRVMPLNPTQALITASLLVLCGTTVSLQFYHEMSEETSQWDIPQLTSIPYHP